MYTLPAVSRSVGIKVCAAAAVNVTQAVGAHDEEGVQDVQRGQEGRLSARLQVQAPLR